MRESLRLATMGSKLQTARPMSCFTTDRTLSMIAHHPETSSRSLAAWLLGQEYLGDTPHFPEAQRVDVRKTEAHHREGMQGVSRRWGLLGTREQEGPAMVDARVADVVAEATDGQSLGEDEITTLLDVPPHSVESGYVMAAADAMNRLASNGKAEVHAQIGLNLSPCPRNCSCCAFAAKNRIFTERSELTLEEVTAMALRAEANGANALFFMATGDYPFGKFVEVSSEVRRKVEPQTVMIANIGDFG